MIWSLFMQNLKNHIASFFPYAQKQLGFERPPKLFFVNDEGNAGDTLGKTAHYEPETETIKVYVTNRHPKDVLRSFSHELVHHAQNCRGDFDNDTVTEEGYTQSDPHLREMEREAYEKGNMIFRDYCDGLTNNGGLEQMSMTEEKLREAVRAAIQRLAEKNGKVSLEGKTEQVDEGEVPDQLKPFVKGKKKKDEGEDDSKGNAEEEEAEAKEEDAEKGAEELDESPSHPASDRNQGRSQRQKDVSSGEREENVAESVDELKEWYLGTLSEALVKKFTK